jgi:hypothetical protein
MALPIPRAEPVTIATLLTTHPSFERQRLANSDWRLENQRQQIANSEW